MFKQHPKSKKIESTIAASVNYEISISDLAKRSERRAWMVAIFSLIMSIILAAGYFYMLPLKEKIPFMVMADAYSGTASVARLQDDFAYQQISTNEAINRSNVSNYIISRESFDLNLINLRDWNTVHTMSTSAIANSYRAIHAENNVNAPAKVYGKNKSIRIKILSVVFIGGNALKNIPPKGATVRFQRRLYDKTNGVTKHLDNKIATLSFIYNRNLNLDEPKRVINPLGFQITEYRVDEDYALPPPAEIEDNNTNVLSAAN